MRRQLIRADGTTQDLPARATISEIQRLIGARSLDTVNLRDGTVMWVDDLGHQHGLPVNAEGTRLYHSICYPGATHEIVGDVVVTPDADFGDA